LKARVDDVNCTLIVAEAPALVVTRIVSAPGDKAVISAVMLFSETVTLPIDTRPPSAVTLSVVNRLCPLIVTIILEPTKRTFGLIVVITGGPVTVVELVIEIILPTSSYVYVTPVDPCMTLTNLPVSS